MKKLFSFFIIMMIFMCVVVGCSKNNVSLQVDNPAVVPEGFEDRFQTVSQIAASRLTLAASPQNLTEVSDLVIVFTPQTQRNIDLFYSDGVSASGYTETAGKIEQVLQGNAAVGDIIEITEECYVPASGNILCTQGGYLPMNIGESYLLFLKAYPAYYEAYTGMYFPVDLEHGKYTLSPEVSTASMDASTFLTEFEVNGYTDLNDYSQWYAYVQELYPELF